MIPWTKQLMHGLLLWALMSVLFILGNENGGSDNTVSVFPNLLSPIALATYVYWISRKYSARNEKYRLAKKAESISAVVLIAAILMIPVASGYAFYSFDGRPWQMLWSAAFMSFVAIFAIGYLVTWISVWAVSKRSNQISKRDAG